MANDRQRLRRAQLIERVRTAEHRQAAVRAFEAEATRCKLEALAMRTHELAAHYTPAGDGLSVADLRSTGLFAHHLRSLGRTAGEQAEHARVTADGSLSHLATAERRRDRAESDRRDLRRAVIERRFGPELPMLKRTGTDVE
jgi:hypothetical protein